MVDNIKNLTASDNEAIVFQTLADIDKALIDYFLNLNLYTIENNKKIDIPVLMSNPERWKQFTEFRFILDNVKQPILPLLFVKRDTIEFVDDRHIYSTDENGEITIVKKESNLSKFKQNPEYYLLKIKPPRWISVSYTINIYTRYVMSYNSILEQLMYGGQKINIANKDGYYNLKGELGSFSDSSSTENFAEEEIRMVAGNTTLTLQGNLATDKVTNPVHKVFVPNSISFSERVLT